MSRSAFHLTPGERIELEAALQQTHHVGTWRRIRALLLLAEGHGVAETAHLLAVRRQAVHRWRTLFERERRSDSLQQQLRPGRPPTQRQVAHEAVARLLEEPPTAHGYRATAWTVPLLQRHLSEAQGHSLSASTLRRTLHALGYRWKRPRYVPARRDPDREGESGGR